MLTRWVVAATLLVAAPAVASPAVVSGDCGEVSSGGRSNFLGGLLGDLKKVGFVVGAHVLNVVDHSPAYPEDDANRVSRAARIAKDLAKSSKSWTADQKTVLAELRATGVDDVDLFHGSHVVVKDGGERYRLWQTLANARARTSSHYPGVTDTQFEIVLPDNGVVLFGLTGDGDTWFQTEAHADSTGLEWALHRLDYVKHKGFGYVNVGPLGLSPHSEKKDTEIVVTP